MQLFGTGRIGEASGAQSQFCGSEVPDAITVHRHGSGAGRGDHGDALSFQFGQCVHGQCFDLGNDHGGPMAPHHLQQSLRFSHRQDFRQISHLHGGCSGIAIAGDHPAAQALGGDGHLLAQFTTAQQHHGGGKRRHGLFQGSMD